MNNAFLQLNNEEPEVAKPIYRQQSEELTEIIEALQHIAQSSFWKVLSQHIFEVDLKKAKDRLASEKDTTEIFRLQGEIQWGEKFNLEKLLVKYRNQLDSVRKKL